MQFIDWIRLQKSCGFQTSCFSCEAFQFSKLFHRRNWFPIFFPCKLLKLYKTEKNRFSVILNRFAKNLSFFKQAVRAWKLWTISNDFLDWNGSPNNQLFRQTIWSMKLSISSLLFLDWISSRTHLRFSKQAF